MRVPPRSQALWARLRVSAENAQTINHKDTITQYIVFVNRLFLYIASYLAEEIGPQLIQEQEEQERKDRTNRLCKHMGFIEKLLPDTIPLTEEQFKTFVEQTIATEHSRRILDGLTAQNAATAPAQGAGTAGRGNTQPAAKTAQTAQEDGADGSAAQG